MNQNFTIEINDTTCSICYCEDRFLHHVWNGEKGSHKMCTSCVMFEHKERFCPTCFGLIVDPGREMLIHCSECSSYTHARCISTNDKPFKCSTCRNPESLIFDLQELRDLEPKKDGGCHKVMDMKAARLLLTAAELVQKLISEAHDAAACSAVKHATDTISAKKKAIEAARRFLIFEESNDGPSLLDSSPETSRGTWEAAN